MAEYKWRLAFKYDPNQPREPAGNPGGGRWTAAPGIEPMTEDEARVYVKERVRHVSWVTDKKRPLDEAETQKMVKLIRKHPAQVINEIREIRLCDTPQDFEMDFGDANEAKTCEAFCRTMARALVFRSMPRQITFHHEVGHILWEMASPKLLTDNWLKPYTIDETFDRHTTYSRKNWEEAFCESYAPYVKLNGRPPKTSTYTPTFERVRAVVEGIKP